MAHILLTLMLHLVHAGKQSEYAITPFTSNMLFSSQLAFHTAIPNLFETLMAWP